MSYYIEVQYSIRNIGRSMGEPHWSRDASWERSEYAYKKKSVAESDAKLLEDTRDSFFKTYTQVVFVGEAR